MSRYESFGPFSLDRKGHRVAPGALKRFWKSRLIDSPEGIASAVGVYVISVRSQENGELLPWYVGRTDKQGFEKRFRQQELHLRQVLDVAKTGEVEIFLLAFMSPSGKKFRRVTKTTMLIHNDWLETMLIGSAYSRNRRLINTSKMKYFRTMVVPGYLNSPKRALGKSATTLQNMLKLS